VKGIIHGSLKIVHCANFSESKNGAVFYAIDRKISNGLIRNGHFVYDFSYREIAKSLAFFKSKKFGAKKMNQALIKVIDNIKPDLLLLGHSEIVFNDTLDEIKRIYPNMKVAMWWVDPFDNIGHIHHRIKYLDAFFATTDPLYFGKLFKTKTSFFYIPNLCDNSIETKKSFENKDHKYDLIFIGRDDENRREFIQQLNGLKNINYKHFGASRDTLVLGNDFLELLYQSKMAVNYSRFNDISLYSSDRVVQLAGQGVLVFTPRIPNFETLFTEEEVVYFDDFNDLEQKVSYYLKHENERVKIARAGHKKAHEIFNETVVTHHMLEKIYN
jgi:hypothetical protein